MRLLTFIIFLFASCLVSFSQNLNASGEINEAGEDGDSIIVTLVNTGDTVKFKDPLDIANWSLNDAPTGVSIGSLVREDSVTITVILSATGTVQDYDSDITNAYITVDSNDVEKLGAENISSGGGITFYGSGSTESISLSWGNPPNTGGAEATLSDEVVRVTLSGGTYVTDSLTADNVILSGTAVDAGVTMESISNITSTTFDLAINYSGSDFDTNKVLTVEIYGETYDDGTDILSNDITITADNDDEVITASWAATPGTNGAEATLDDEIINVTLVGGEFITGNINTTNVTLSGTAVTQGVTIESINNVTTTSFDIALDYASGIDFDTNKVLTITIDASAYNEGDPDLSDDLTITADNDDEIVTASWAATPGTNGAEATLDDEIINVTLVGGGFITGNINATNVTLSGTAVTQGVTIESISNITSTSFDIALDYASGIDFDTNKVLTVTIDASAYNEGDPDLSDDLTITADNDDEIITASWAATPGTNGAEATLDDEIINVTLVGGEFITGNINGTNVTLSGTAITQGVTLESISNVTTTSFDIAIDYASGIDFDTDKTLTINVAGVAYDEGNSIISDDITVDADSDDEIITAVWAATPGTNGAEATLDDEIINVTLVGGEFITGNINATNVTLSGTAVTQGVTLESISNVTTTSFDIAIDYTSGIDFDTDKTLTINVAGAAYDEGSSTISGDITVDATNDDEIITASWAATPGTNGAEATLDDEIINVTLVGGEFITGNINATNVTLSGTAVTQGVTLESISNVTTTSFDIAIDYASGIDFDTDKTLTINVAGAAYDEGSSTISGDITVDATSDDEIITASWAATPGTNGAEATLDDEIINVTLVGGEFVTGNINTTNVTLSGNAVTQGVTLDSVFNVTSNSFSIAIDYASGIDFDDDKTLTVNVAAAAYDEGNSTISDDITVDANSDEEIFTATWAATPGTNGAEATLDDEIINITLTGGEFVTGNINTTNVTLSGTAVAQGVTIGSISNVTSNSFDIALNYTSGIDFDTNKLLIINVDEIAYDEGSLPLSDTLDIIADSDPESITAVWAATPGTNGAEATLDDEIINITLTGGEFVTGNINTTNVTLSGTAVTQGVTIESISNITPTSFDIALGYASGIDFDTNKVLTITIDASAYDEGDPDLSDDLTITADNDPESITAVWAATPGTNGAEATLDDEIINVTLTGGEFVTGNINTTNVTLSGTAVTQGVTIESISNITPTSFDIALDYASGIDFDTNKVLTITIDASAYNEGDPDLSDDLTITANSDPESITAAWAATPGTNGAEATLDDEIINITLTGGEFVTGNINTTNVIISGTAVTQGVTIESISNITPTSFDIALDYASGIDFDTNKILTITIDASAYNEGDPDLSDDLTIMANSDPESITATWAATPGTNGAEATLNDEIINIALTGGEFVIGNINATNVTISGTAVTQGVTIESISNITSTSFDIAIDYASGIDFDTNKVLTITIDASAYNEGDPDLSDDLTITADNDPESITAVWAATPGTNGEEATLDNEIVSITLAGGEFITDSINITYVTISGTAVTQGVTIESIYNVTATSFDVALAYSSGIDFDSDKTLTINIDAAAYDEGNTTLTDNLTITADNDDETLSLAWKNPPGTNGNELTLDDEIVEVTLSGGTLITGLVNETNVTLSGTAVSQGGLSIESIQNITTTSFDILLAYDDTDFDDDKTLTVRLSGNVYDDGSSTISESILVNSVQEPAQISILPVSITEGLENNTTLNIVMIEDTFVISELTTSNISILNIPEGVSIGEILYVNKNQIDIVLSGNRTVDYDSDRDITVEILPIALQVYTDTVTATTTITSIQDNESISMTGTINESYENGDSIIVTVTGGTFAPALNTANWTLSNLPTGVTKGSLIRFNDTTVIILLNGNRTLDYDTDITNTTLSITDAEIDEYAGANKTLNSGVMFKSLDDAESIAGTFLNGGNEGTLDSEEITINLTGGTFVVGAINTTNVQLSAVKDTIGLTLDSINNITSNSFVMHLSWDGTDFDFNRELIISMDPSTYNDGGSILYDTVTLIANDDAESINLSWNSIPGTNGGEKTLDNDVIRVDISGGTLIISEINTSNVTLSGSATSVGISLESITSVTQTSFLVNINWDETDFDTNKVIQIDVSGDAYNEGNTLLSDNIAVNAIDEKVVFGKHTYLESNIVLGGDTIVLNLDGAVWIPADGIDGTNTNDYKSATIDTLFGGIMHIKGFDDIKDFRNGLKNATSGTDNDVVKRKNDTTLLLVLPEMPEYDIFGNESIRFFISNLLLDGTNGSEITDTLEIRETAATTAAILGGGEICDDGSTAQITIALGGLKPWTIEYAIVVGTDTTIQPLITGINKSVYTFETSIPGRYIIKSVQDANFTVVEPNVKINNDNDIDVIINSLPSVNINPLIPKTYANEGDNVNIASYGIPSGGRFYGSGIYHDTIFAPLLADTANIIPHQLIYEYTDIKGCKNTDTVLVRVLKSSSEIFIPPFSDISCWYDSAFQVTGLNSSGNIGTFSISGDNPSALIDHGNDTATVYPALLSKEGRYQVEYSYTDGSVTFTDTAGFSLVTINPLTLEFDMDSVCNNGEPFGITGGNDKNIEGNLSSLSGIFSASGNTGTFNPVNAISSTETIIYTIENGGCVRDTSRVITILTAPEPNFGLASNCIGVSDSTQFINNTDTTIGDIFWRWYLEGTQVGEQSTEFEPKFKYNLAGVKTIKLTATVDNGVVCAATDSISVNLIQSPIANFTEGAGCYNTALPAELSNTSESASFSTDNAFWYVNNDTIETKHLSYSFSEAGSYDVTLKQVNPNGCADSITKTILLRPTIVINELTDNSYFEDFNGSENDWLKDTASVSSWVLETPNANVILNSANKAWYTNIENTDEEESSVESPCFNFTGIERPMIKMNIWRSLNSNNQGVVLQYQTTGSSNWNTIGTTQEGINWYNSTDIDNKPGGSSVGWAGEFNFTEDTSWVSARHAIDELADNSSVRFRVVFGSEEVTTKIGEGFAFDDFWIGERQRIVLLEHFTNTAIQTSFTANNLVNSITDTNDVIVLQYHTPNPDSDPFFNDNRSDLSARFLYYRNSTVPRSVMDGAPENKNWSYDYVNREWNTTDPGKRVLEDAKFNIKINNAITDGDILSVEATIQANSGFSNINLIAYVVVYERQIEDIASETHYNVVKKILPDAAGISLKTAWNKDDSVVISQGWKIENVYDISKLRVAVFVQDNNTSEVYQVNSSMLSSGTITNIANKANYDNTHSIITYPNPTPGIINIEFENASFEEITVDVVNQLGDVILTQQANMGKVNQLNLTGLKNGIYVVKVYGNGININKKIILVK